MRPEDTFTCTTPAFGWGGENKKKNNIVGKSVGSTQLNTCSCGHRSGHYRGVKAPGSRSPSRGPSCSAAVVCVGGVLQRVVWCTFEADAFGSRSTGSCVWSRTQWMPILRRELWLHQSSSNRCKKIYENFTPFNLPSSTIITECTSQSALLEILAVHVHRCVRMDLLCIYAYTLQTPPLLFTV